MHKIDEFIDGKDGDAISFDVVNNKAITKFIKDNKIPKDIYLKNISLFIDYLDNIDHKTLEYNKVKKVIYIFDNFTKIPPRRVNTLNDEIISNSIEYQEITPIKFSSEKNFILKHIMNIDKEIPKKGIYLSGTNGSGKTTLYRVLAKKLSKHGTVYFLRYTDMIKIIKSHFKDNKALNVIDNLQDVDFLIIDDFDKSGFNNEYICNSVLFSIFDYRASHNKLTYINSNYTLKQLSELADESIDTTRVVERIFMCCDDFDLADENFRRK